MEVIIRIQCSGPIIRDLCLAMFKKKYYNDKLLSSLQLISLVCLLLRNLVLPSNFIIFGFTIISLFHGESFLNIVNQMRCSSEIKIKKLSWKEFVEENGFDQIK